ncbi:hypothetical protein V2J09_022501 [Rumex salicifolius]
MKKSFWDVYCGENSESSAEILAIFNPFSCINNALVISLDVFIIAFSLYILLRKSSSWRNVSIRSYSECRWPLIFSLISAKFNGVLSLLYLGVGVWSLVEKFLPFHGWLLLLFQGLTWLMLTSTLTFKRHKLFSRAIASKLYFLLTFLFAAFLCLTSIWMAVVLKEASVKTVLDIISFPGLILLLFSAFHERNDAEIEIDHHHLYEPLQAEAYTDENVTPFDRAGLFSKLTFWWLNPLMSKGKAKTLEDGDIPILRQADRAQTCYSKFMELLFRKNKSHSPPIVSTLFLWQWKPILVSGFFALIKVLATSTCPIFLKFFIKVAEGEEAFSYEGYVLSLGLFVVKCVESFSERQWYFKMRLVGVQVRSVLCATIYKNVLKVSPSAKFTSGEVVSFVTIDAYRLGEFPFWLHQIWATPLQLLLALLIIYYCIGLAALAAVMVIIITVLGNSPVAKLQTKYQRKFMEKQDKLVQFISVSLSAMKVLKLYAWDMHFKKTVEGLREEEYVWLKAIQLQKGYYVILFWLAPVLVPMAAFGACYFLGIALTTANVFTFLATVRLVQEPIRSLPDVVGAFIDAKVALNRVTMFLEAPELQSSRNDRKQDVAGGDAVSIKAKGISWDDTCERPNLRKIDIVVKAGEKVAICGEVGAGKTTLLAAILGEVPYIDGKVEVNGKIAYVSQTAWIQTGTIQENILFGSSMDTSRYQDTLAKCCLIKDLEMLPFGDLTVIGERGVNLSGGQKQRVQLARALYQNADIYIMDDPFSAVDAHTATSLFNGYVMEALAGKTVLLVTHQVDFLPVFHSILLMSDGEVLRAGNYIELLALSEEFNTLVNAHSNFGSNNNLDDEISNNKGSRSEIQKMITTEQFSMAEQLVQKEEKETGDRGLKPYFQYMKHGKGFLYVSLATIAHVLFIIGQFIQTYWLAANLQSSSMSEATLVAIYALLGLPLFVFLFLRALFVVILSLGTSRSIFSSLNKSIFKAPMSFYDSTPLGRILSRVSSDLSIIDLDLPSRLTITIGSTFNTYFCFGLLTILAWEVLFLIIPMIYLTIVLQKYFFTTAKELMRINGTTKSALASHVAETAAGVTTIRALGGEDQFFTKNLDLIDKDASPFFHSFAANEWFIERLEIACSVVLSAAALFMTVFPHSTSSAGYIGMALSYGISLNFFLTVSVRSQCMLSNMMVSVERLEQYMNIPSEAPEIIENNRPSISWPDKGKVEICNLKVRYQPNSPLVLLGISCVFEGGHKIGIVGRTGSGKTTLINTLFRLVEPTEGKIVIDGVDISTIGLHDLRSHFGVIPQEATLFGGSVRYNLDPLSEHSDQELWEVLEKCQLKEAVQEKQEGLSSLVVQDGSNWSMGQRQLFCLGRALLKTRRILVLDEATASIDNATDSIIQKTIRTEFASSTVITVAHRIPTVMDCTRVLSMSYGKMVEYDDPAKLMTEEGSLFGQLVREYQAHTANTSFSMED